MSIQSEWLADACSFSSLWDIDALPQRAGRAEQQQTPSENTSQLASKGGKSNVETANVTQRIHESGTTNMASTLLLAFIQ